MLRLLQYIDVGVSVTLCFLVLFTGTNVVFTLDDGSDTNAVTPSALANSLASSTWCLLCSNIQYNIYDEQLLMYILLTI